MSLLIEALRKEVADEAKEAKVVAENPTVSGVVTSSNNENRRDRERWTGEWGDDRPWSGDWGQGWGDYPPVRPGELLKEDKKV